MGIYVNWPRYFDPGIIPVDMSRLERNGCIIYSLFPSEKLFFFQCGLLVSVGQVINHHMFAEWILLKIFKLKVKIK
jgi:hypothetical protein